MYARFTIKPAKSNLSFLIKILRSNSNKTLKDIEIYKLRTMLPPTNMKSYKNLCYGIYTIFFILQALFLC